MMQSSLLMLFCHFEPTEYLYLWDNNSQQICELLFFFPIHWGCYSIKSVQDYLIFQQEGKFYCVKESSDSLKMTFYRRLMLCCCYSIIGRHFYIHLFVSANSFFCKLKEVK
ncbi:unnamed protein product [Coffea canephora]|uniref:Uncharacterized protein n=1 Tax=Coffea canephora TaxID=49390 RepID=A0A068VCI1_COFCA|nr:unnamed protein product [Coffea canephora]